MRRAFADDRGTPSSGISEPLVESEGPSVTTDSRVDRCGLTADPRPGIVLHDVVLPEQSAEGVFIWFVADPGVEYGADGRPPLLFGADMLQASVDVVVMEADRRVTNIVNEERRALGITVTRVPFQPLLMNILF